jgi:hypothetical protein
VLIKAQSILKNEVIPTLAKRVPDISIKNGKASSPVVQPFQERVEALELLFILDTKGSIKSLDPGVKSLTILLTETELHVRDQNGHIEIKNLKEVFPEDFDVTGQGVQEALEKFSPWLAVIAFPFCLFASLFLALITMLLASIPGVIFNAIFGSDVSYGALLRFAAVGMTFPVYLWMALYLLREQIPPPPIHPMYVGGVGCLVYFGLTVFYVAFGTIVNLPVDEHSY